MQQKMLISKHIKKLTATKGRTDFLIEKRKERGILSDSLFLDSEEIGQSSSNGDPFEDSDSSVSPLWSEELVAEVNEEEKKMQGRGILKELSDKPDYTNRQVINEDDVEDNFRDMGIYDPPKLPKGSQKLISILKNKKEDPIPRLESKNTLGLPQISVSHQSSSVSNTNFYSPPKLKSRRSSSHDYST